MLEKPKLFIGCCGCLIFEIKRRKPKNYENTKNMDVVLGKNSLNFWELTTSLWRGQILLAFTSMVA
jgi:hypothetical protein